MVGTEAGGIWICSACKRRVPMRVAVCRCGVARGEAGPNLPPPLAAAPVDASGPADAAAPPPPPARAYVAPRPVVVRGSFDDSLRYPREQPLFLIGAIFSGLAWLALVLSLVGIFYGVIGLVFGLIAHALYFAHLRGNALRVSERQLPEVYQAAERAAQALGMAETPEVYVTAGHGVLNAFATKLLSRKVVVIHSELVDACSDPRQLEFVIGHEVGHIAAGHLMWNTFLWPFMLVPLLGVAYSRAREYTCDRCGLAVMQDQDAAMRGLIVLAAGGRQAARADVAAFMEQREDSGSFWSAVVELSSTHPFLCKRVARIHEVAHPGSLEPVGRNPFAYPLAPLLAFGSLGGAGGGLVSLLMVVAIVGIIAAIAIPSLLRARVAANEAATIQTLRTVVTAEGSFVRQAGRYGSNDCLVVPASCIPGYAGAAFLDAELANETRQGYKRALDVSNDGRAFVLRAEPLSPGQTGFRFFCADSTGMFCANTQQVDTNGYACDRRSCQSLR